MPLSGIAGVIKRMLKHPGAKRKSEGAEVPMKQGRTTSRREGPLLESSFWKR